MGDSLSGLFEQETEFGSETNFTGAASPEDIFSILETLENVSEFSPLGEAVPSSKEGGEEATSAAPRLASQKSSSSSVLQEYSETEIEAEASPKSKRPKLAATASSEDANASDGQQRISHITVERNRRKQMNEHLSVLRSLMPCFYVKRGDQASIIGGVVDYISELQQVLQSLEAKKQRKVYSEVLSPRLQVSSPRVLLPSSPLSPRKPPLSPRLSLPISPRTPQPSSPYKPRLQQTSYLSSSPTMPTTTSVLDPSPTSSSTSSIDNANELVANSKSAIADVEVKFSGPNVLLKTVSPRIPGQALKIISALEDLSLEILHASISTSDETMFNSFTIKIGIECQLSAEELAQQVQQTFC
ncbi:transcription factor SPEECHLESS [Malania oleifera]|uniref:transcription factor SPEECHLESS n=1 Tax=Malania oleifera TaxID=397392 RepID=UPI0025AE7241|nr:transcription factor SPEECHLESS [Malania oleifera]